MSIEVVSHELGNEWLLAL